MLGRAKPAEPSAKGAAQSDNRTGPRRKVFLQSAKLFDEHGALLEEVRLRDVSMAGMMMVLPVERAIPKFVRVQVDHTGVNVACNLVWVRGRLAGLRVMYDDLGKWATYSAEGNERRGGARRRVHMQTVKLVNERGGLIADATLRDISQTGMQLALAVPRDVPIRFRVLIEHSGALVNCVVAWRRNRLMGLKIVQ